jgi:hypothetical protein
VCLIRARVSRPGADDRATNRARETDVGRGARSVRGTAWGGAGGSALVGPRSDLSVFKEGYSATAGDDWMRPGLCDDALRLGRILAELAPAEPEVHGLVALMEVQASRLGALVGAGGPILLLDQNRIRWDHVLVRRGLAALERAERLGGALGPYALQGAIAACHARAVTADDTVWVRVAALYGLRAGRHGAVQIDDRGRRQLGQWFMSRRATIH